MPALVNISVGSLRGTSGDDGTTSWPFSAKQSRKLDLISLTPLIPGCPSIASVPRCLCGEFAVRAPALRSLPVLLAAPPFPVQKAPARAHNARLSDASALLAGAPRAVAASREPTPALPAPRRLLI